MVSSVATRVPRRLWTSTVAAAVLASSLLVTGVSATSVPGPPNGDTVGPVEVSGAVHSDVSAPLSSLVGVAPPASTDTQTHERPLRVLPNMGNALNQADGALQTSSGPLVPTTSLFPPFAGIGDTSNTPANHCNCAPPDTNGAVGATQYVQWVNTAFAVYDKATGAIAAGFPTPGNTLWAGFGGGCETNNSGYPIVQYDKAANRWIFTQFSVSTTPYLQCIAVSQTSDATGAYNRYAYSFGTQFPDYPKLGVWPDGYYMSFNIFSNGSTWAGAKVCAFDRTKMLVLGDTTATMQCFPLSTSYSSLLPSDLDGATAPPTGSPDYFMNFGKNSLNLWKFHADFTTPSNAKLTGPTNIPVASFSPACGGGTCIPQPQTGQRLDSLGDRLMYRLAYRNFGNYGSLVVTHSVTGSGTAAPRWYELRSSPVGTFNYMINQQSSYAPDATYRWMGSAAQDKLGDLAIGYSASSSTISPQIRYTGRVAAVDQLGQLRAESTVALPSTGSNTGPYSRWGDYSSMVTDPLDDCTFWYTNEYLKQDGGSFTWSTHIVSFKFSSC